MLIFLPGDAPRCALLRESLVEAGFTLTEVIAEADVWFCCQPLPNSIGAVMRHDTLVEVHDRAHEFGKLIVVCLVTFHPCINWPPGFAHAVERTLQNNTTIPWEITRVHVRTSFLERTSSLILGADSPTAVALMKQIWQPLIDEPLPERMGSVLRAELEAEQDSVISADA